MTTLAPQQINIMLPGDASVFLNREAKRQKASISDVMVEIIKDYMERREDMYFSALSEKIEAETTSFHSHEEAWA